MTDRLIRNPKRDKYIARVKTTCIICALICLIATTGILSCKPKKSPEQQILDTLNGYLKTQGTGDFEHSYTYLATQTKKLVSERVWVLNQLDGINSVRLMRNPKLTNIVIKDDTATADFYYQGIPSDVLAKVIGQIYTQNFIAPPKAIHEATERYLNEHFDEVSQPQQKVLIFARSFGKWGLWLDEKGNPYGTKYDEPSKQGAPGK